MSIAAPSVVVGWSRPRRVAELIIVLWMIGACDLFLTLWAHHYTPFYELNPLARYLLSLDAQTSLVLFKVACMLIASAALWLTRRTKRCEFAAWGMTTVYFVLMFKWSTYWVQVLQ